MSGTASVKRVTAVVVTYQSARTIAATLASLRRCLDAGLLDTVIVDNNSTDATRSALRREAHWARVILSESNNGFGRGCNIGFGYVTSPYTILVNPDAVVEPAALATLVRFMEDHPHAGIAGPAIICGADERNTVLQHTGPCPTPSTILRDAMPLLRRQPRRVIIVPGGAPIRTGWVSGAVLMIRTQLVQQLGGFDPRFFLYWEETDLCKRAQDAGYEIWAVGSAVARHVVGASSASTDERIGSAIARHYLQSRYYYMVKHHGWLAATTAEVGEFVLLGMESLIDVARGRGLNRMRPRLQASLLSMPERASHEH